ncbi:MAG: GntR family transcriptional regulator [Anaerolineae bacterium]|nr:GntR family transcriptional regulator [Anaerolineae bacterium]
MDFSGVDPHRSEQLYLQIRRLVVEAIQNNALLPGQQIPSIAAIARQARVSRMTVRQALDALIHEGWIQTVPGKGSFVARKTPVVLDLEHVVGWSDEMRRQGIEPSARLISAEVIPADPTVARALDLPVSTAVYRIVRVQYAGEVPLGVDTTYLPAGRFPGFAAHIAANPASISKVMVEQYGIRLPHGIQFVEAISVDRATAELIGVLPGSPVLLAERTTFAADDTPVQFVQAVHRSGLVRLKIRLTNTFSPYN